MVAALQHLAGLAMAVVLYLVLRRRGVPNWLAALATAPVLLDAYQLQIEQSIMPDTAFEVLIVAGLAVLLWERRPPTALVLAGGLALGASATVRQVGEIFILPAPALPAGRRARVAAQADAGGGAGGRVRAAHPVHQLPQLRDDQALRAGPATRPARSTGGPPRRPTAPRSRCPATNARSAQRTSSNCSARTGWTTAPDRRSRPPSRPRACRTSRSPTSSAARC